MCIRYRERVTKQKVTRNNLKEGPWPRSCGLNSDVLNSITSWRASHNSPGNMRPSSLDDFCCNQSPRGHFCNVSGPRLPLSWGPKWELDRYDVMKKPIFSLFFPLCSLSRSWIIEAAKFPFHLSYCSTKTCCAVLSITTCVVVHHLHAALCFLFLKPQVIAALYISTLCSSFTHR